ncbi:MAG: ABC transporter substrate-binding protein [Oscillospiraceae bacterium]|nr:ABC transporter substrate-binding protein [Oscillospiraceae bacterium]
MKKKFFALMMACVMAFTMTACGGGADTTGDTTSGDTQSGGQTASDSIVIGTIGPLTGPYANYGLSVKQGAEVAVAEINAAGGINGKQVVLLSEDSQGDPDSAVSAYGKLMDDGIHALLGCTLSGETANVVAAAAEDDVMILTPSGSADKCLEGNDKAFRVCFYDSYQGTAAAQYIVDNALATEVAILYQSDVDYSVGLYNSFKAKCEESNIKIVETQTFTASTATDFSTQVDALVASGAKVVFTPIYAEEASTFLTQAKGKFASDVYFFGADGLDGILGKVEQDPSIANNVLMLTPFAADSDDAGVKSFVESYQTAYGATPDQFAAGSYDGVYVLKAAIEKAGSTSGAAMAQAMTEITVEGITGSMTWTADGNTSKAASAILYFDGVGKLFG